MPIFKISGPEMNKLVISDGGQRVDMTPACSGNCQQGQRACPCPTACELPEDDKPSPAFTRLQAVLVGALIGFTGWFLWDAVVNVEWFPLLAALTI